MKRMDLSGQRFGKLTVICPAPKTNIKTKWQIKCDCGTIKTVQTSDLRSGRTISCGCSKLPRIAMLKFSHGHTSAGKQSAEYICWAHIVRRCENKNSYAFNHYGGRGITICDRWRSSFENFLKDMGKRPSANHSIDRIDNNGNYTPENCRWATQREQTRNTRRNVMVTINGITKCATDWAADLGITDSAMRGRISRGKYEITKHE